LQAKPVIFLFFGKESILSWPSLKNDSFYALACSYIVAAIRWSKRKALSAGGKWL
jgi:hypothetical protein